MGLEAGLPNTRFRLTSAFSGGLHRVSQSWSVPYGPKPKKPQYIGAITNNTVYSRLAPGVLSTVQELNPRTESGHRKHKNFQFLTPDCGYPSLKEHLVAIVALMKASDNKTRFLTMPDRAFSEWKPAPLFDQLEDTSA